MREFDVHFSFYDEQYGNFEDMSYKVMAETPFEAREKAWPVCDQDSDTLFRSNIKQFAVTWTPNLMDAGDYFYAQAASVKQSIAQINNVQIPNARISDPQREQSLKAEQQFYFGSLHTIDYMAKDLYADKGMLPPSVYEELHYTEKLCENLGWGEKADALWDRMDKAKKWDRGAIYAIRELFKDGYTWLCGETTRFREQFDRHGVYPVHGKLDEHDYSFISRWQRARKIDNPQRLPELTKADVIPHSAEHMDLYGQTLLLDFERASEQYRVPVNMLWTTTDIAGISESAMKGVFLAENLITGVRMSCSREDFHGVLRPEIAAGFDFDALKNTLSTIQKGQHDQSEQQEKPSVLARLHEGKQTAVQSGESAKSAPKRNSEREV